MSSSDDPSGGRFAYGRLYATVDVFASGQLVTIDVAGRSHGRR